MFGYVHLKSRAFAHQFRQFVHLGCAAGQINAVSVNIRGQLRRRTLQDHFYIIDDRIKMRSEELGQIRDLIAENEALKEEVAELTIENTGLQQDRYELTNLRELYKLDSQYDEYEKIGARIIARDSGNWFYSFVINKGSDDGLAVDMNVMAGSGLVGRIVDIGPNWAKVKSIIADDSNVSAMVLSSSDNMIVTGDLKL